MDFESIRKELHGVPYISEGNAKLLYQLIQDENIGDILELGIAHGTATCYMAASLRKRGGGSIVSVGLENVRDVFKPSAEEQINRLGFDDIVSVKRMQTGYTWYLHNAIRDATKDDVCVPCFDLCIVDGPKNWTIDGAAFFMADKLLREGGWIIFDDYNWSYGWADGRKTSTDGITHRELSEDEIKTPQVREVFELLVRQHPDYSNFRVIDNDWAIAQKVSSSVKETVYVARHEETYANMANRVFKKIRNTVRGRG